MPSSRAEFRNVWIKFSAEPGVTHGGLCAAPNLTNAQSSDMLSIVFSAPSGYEAVHQETGTLLTADDQLLHRGHYILSPRVQGEQMSVTNEQFIDRTLSTSNTARDANFRRKVRERDGQCVISGEINYEAPRRSVGFQDEEASQLQEPIGLAKLYAPG